MRKYQNKYRIPATRLQKWNYGWKSAYFITICTGNRYCYFGKIRKGKIQLSEIGIIAQQLLNEIPKHTENVKLGAYVVMPNHVHVIIVITQNNDRRDKPWLASTVATKQTVAIPGVKKSIGQQRFQNQGSNTISSIIGSYKSAVTKNVHRKGLEFSWQDRFYDRIIHDDESLYFTSRYIYNNPINWVNDKFYR